VGETLYGAYGFAWGFGFVQFLFEFGMSSALSRQVSDAWTRGDRPAVDRTVRCGIAFYALMAVVQAATLLLVAAWGIPDSWDPAARRLIMQLLWLQALTAPCYGASVVLSSLLQAARRYEFVPRYELLIIILRFLVLLVGLKLGLDFFLVIVIQTLVQVILGLGPALYVTIRELRYVPLPGRVAWSDYRSLWNLSLAVFLIQLSVVLADKLDTTILGYALDDPAPAVATYQAVSKPFLQIRQMGWMLAYLVMPAVASLAAARDLVALDRIAYDGTRSLVALLAPVTLLAAIYAEPFLAAWLPQVVSQAWLMQLFLVAALPLVLSVLVQASIGIGHVWPIAILCAHAVSGRLGRDLGYGPHHARLQWPRPRHLRVPASRAPPRAVSLAQPRGASRRIRGLDRRGPLRALAVLGGSCRALAARTLRTTGHSRRHLLPHLSFGLCGHVRGSPGCRRPARAARTSSFRKTRKRECPLAGV
jgi:Na+-driven multidrug efflux pump